MTYQNKDIQINGLYKYYNNTCVIENLTTKFEHSKNTVIFGPSGCGKTTLLRIIAGLEVQDKGEITGVGKNSISYAFQEPRLFPTLSAKDNITCVLSEKDKEKKDETAKYWLDFMKLKNAKNLLPHELSGGMQHRLSLARALAYAREAEERNILLLDEAFTGLDDALKSKLMENIKKEFQDKTILFITHNEKEAEIIGDTIMKFENKMKRVL